ncbi:MAG TPA: type II toxin-antitoxin system RelE/ParE family toxin [Chthoniobacterales bacterium]|nr:type II toxin-antitoxin system RelE/ParE family toxin [Chthoniobacterales bacterium]
MEFKVLIAETAIADLKEIVEFVAHDDPDAAARVGGKLVQNAMGLAIMPERFPLHDLRRGIRKMSSSPFLIFYTVDHREDVVNVLHFWHGARRPPHFSNINK